MSHKNKSSDLMDFLNYNPRPMGKTRAFELCQVHRTTFERWLNGDSQIPAATLELLRLHANGEPPSMVDEWRGFCFTQGKLWTPDNRFGYTPTDIYFMPQLYSAKHELQRIKSSFTLQSKLF